MQYPQTLSINAISSKNNSLYDECLGNVKQYEEFNGTPNSQKVNEINTNKKSSNNPYYFPSSGRNTIPRADVSVMTPSVNMISCVFDGVGPGWGSYPPNQAKLCKPAEITQLGKSSSCGRTVDKGTPPNISLPSGSPREAKVRGVKDVKYGSECCMTGGSCKQAYKDKGNDKQKITEQVQARNIPEPPNKVWPFPPLPLLHGPPWPP